MLTVRSTVYFYKAENLILECCHPDNEVREKDVAAWGLQSTDCIVLLPGRWDALGDHFLTEWLYKKEMHFLSAAFFLEMHFFPHLHNQCVSLFPKPLVAVHLEQIHSAMAQHRNSRSVLLVWCGRSNQEGVKVVFETPWTWLVWTSSSTLAVHNPEPSGNRPGGELWAEPAPPKHPPAPLSHSQRWKWNSKQPLRYPWRDPPCFGFPLPSQPEASPEAEGENEPFHTRHTTQIRCSTEESHLRSQFDSH